jgi:hypothetical protein
MANETKIVEGTPVEVISLAATLASAANTYSGLTGLTMTQLDNTARYPLARAVLNIPDTFAAAPASGAVVELYATMDDILSTSEEAPEPASGDIDFLGHFVGQWIVDNQDVAFLRAIDIVLPSAQKTRWYLKNLTGQILSYSSNPITVTITPYTHGPA